MKLYFLGTGAGTEPIKGIYHSSLALECNGSVYFFDAGEGCSRRAHLCGLDILKTKAIFISHTHLDHVGGLGNLLWNFRKLDYNNNFEGTVCAKTVYITNMTTYDAFRTILSNAEGGYNIRFDLSAKEYSSGKIYEDSSISVTAFPNHHMGENPVRSYSFRIECEGKSIVYSGDLASLSELDNAIGVGCDMLICETGHFKLSEVCEYVRAKNVDTLCFSHNGRDILNHPQESQNAINNIFGKNAFIAKDGLVMEY